MSKALLKQSLSIVTEGIPSYQKAKEKEPPVSKKEIKRGKQFISRPLKKTVKKITLEDIRNEKESKSKLVEENLKKLLILSKPTNIRNSEKIIKRAHAGRYVIEEEKKVEQESLFTEEDFAEFEKELAKMM